MGVHKPTASRGFTFIELIIALAIVAVLAAVAVPSYLSYLRSAEFSDTVSAAQQLKSVVGQCVIAQNGAAGCSQGVRGIPAAISSSAGVVGVSVVDGVITAKAPADANYGVANATYILTPHYKTGSRLQWVATGTGCTQNYTDCD